MSEQVIGEISALFISLKGKSPRLEKACITLDTQGIVNDKFHNTNIERSVLITSLSSYDLALKHGIKMPFGSLGENLLIDYNPYHFKAGTKLRIGTAMLEISQNCTICDHLSNIDESLPTLLKNDRGIFAKVLKAGVIQDKDTIYLMEQ